MNPFSIEPSLLSCSEKHFKEWLYERSEDSLASVRSLWNSNGSSETISWPSSCNTSPTRSPQPPNKFDSIRLTNQGNRLECNSADQFFGFVDHSKHSTTVGSTLAESIVAVNRVSSDKTTCERVRVDTESIVAQIVGRQGERIKQLVTKYRVHIDTPPRGQESVFVITGPKENIALAKAEIEAVAEHFSRRNTMQKYARASVSGTNTATVRVVVPEQAFSRVIGHGGRMVREWQHRYHVIIHTNKEGATNKPTSLTLQGTNQQIHKLIWAIREHLQFHCGLFCSYTFDDAEVRFVAINKATDIAH